MILERWQWYLDDSKRANGKLNQLKAHLIESFYLPEVKDDTI